MKNIFRIFKNDVSRIRSKRVQSLSFESIVKTK